MKLISWNVNGLRAAVNKGFLEYFKEADADIFSIQETKLQEGQVKMDLPYYQEYWNCAEKKGYSGTAVFTKIPPLSVAYGLPEDEHNHEGRVITLEFEDFYLICCYTPNSQDGLRRLDYRCRFEDSLRNHIVSLDAKKPVILCGDLNVAHEEIDLKNPASNRRNAGFTDEERAKFSALLGAGFIDTWRFQHPGEVKYSWWSYRFNARANNAGWRIDYFVVSAALRDRILTTAIHDEITGSDHCPVELVLG
jgi:exodeoxyribonuclease-3